MARTTCPVSVIIPAYNAERFLSRAVESVLKQTVQPEEIIIVNDGSTDGTADIARNFKDRIHYVEQDNGGVAAARNRGLEAAKGEWIAFLDADDCWLSDHLEQCRNVLDADASLRWCCGAHKIVDRNGRAQPVNPKCWRRLASTRVSSVAFFDAWVAGAPIGSCGMVIRRQVFKRSGVFDPALRRGEDRDLWYRIALLHPRMGFVWPPTVLYLHNAESLTAQAGDETERLLETVARNVRRADQLDAETGTSFRRLLRRLARDTLRHSLNRGRCDVLQLLCRDFGLLLSPADRFVARWASRMPPWLLRGLAAVRRRILGVAGARRP